MKIQPLRFQRKRTPGFLFKFGLGALYGGHQFISRWQLKHFVSFFPDVWGDDAIFRSIFKLGWHKPPSRFGFIIPAILRIPSLTNQFFIKHFFRSNGSLMIGGSILRKTPRAHQGFHGFQAFTFHQMTWGFWVMLHFLGLIWGFPKMVVPNNHGFSYQKWS